MLFLLADSYTTEMFGHGVSRAGAVARFDARKDLTMRFVHPCGDFRCGALVLVGPHDVAQRAQQCNERAVVGRLGYGEMETEARLGEGGRTVRDFGRVLERVRYPLEILLSPMPGGELRGRPFDGGFVFRDLREHGRGT